MIKRISILVANVICLFSFALFSLPSSAEFAYECQRNNGTTYQSKEACPSGMAWRKIQTDPYYHSSKNGGTARDSQPERAKQSLEELQADCPKEFDYLAANSGKFQWDYNFRLSALKAKCSVTTLDCYRAFDRLHRYGYDAVGSSNNLDNVIAAKRAAAANRAKCGVPEEPKTSLKCRSDMLGGMNCR